MQICFFRTLFYFHQIIEDPEFIVVFGARPGFMSVFEHKLYAAPRVFFASSIRAREPRGEWDGTCPAGYSRYSLPFFAVRQRAHHQSTSTQIIVNSRKLTILLLRALHCTRRFVYFFVLFSRRTYLDREKCLQFVYLSCFVVVYFRVGCRREGRVNGIGRDNVCSPRQIIIETLFYGFVVVLDRWQLPTMMNFNLIVLHAETN